MLKLVWNYRDICVFFVRASGPERSELKQRWWMILRDKALNTFWRYCWKYLKLADKAARRCAQFQVSLSSARGVSLLRWDTLTYPCASTSTWMALPASFEADFLWRVSAHFWAFSPAQYTLCAKARQCTEDSSLSFLPVYMPLSTQSNHSNKFICSTVL